MKVITVIDPFTYAVDGFKALLLKNTGLAAISGDMFFLAVFTVFHGGGYPSFQPRSVSPRSGEKSLSGRARVFAKARGPNLFSRRRAEFLCPEIAVAACCIVDFAHPYLRIAGVHDVGAVLGACEHAFERLFRRGVADRQIFPDSRGGIAAFEDIFIELFAGAKLMGADSRVWPCPWHDAARP